MSVTSIKAGAAFYEIFADDKTGSGLSSAEQKLKAFGARIGAIGAAMTATSAAGIAGITAMIKAFAGAGDEISDAMNVTGLSSDFLQALQFGAADAGVNLNTLVGSLTKFNITLSKAANGNKAAIASFANLGLNVNDLMAMNPDERFKAVASAIANIPDPANRAAAAMAMFGKTGAKLLPAMEGGAEALNAQLNDLSSRGLIMSDEDRQIAAQAEGAFLSLGLVLERVSQVIAASVTPAFLVIADVIQSAIEQVVTFIDNNRTLVALAAGGLVVLGGLGIAFMAIGAACIAAAFATTGLAAAMTALSVAGAILASPVTIIALAIAACGAAALLSAYYLDRLFNGGAAVQFLQDAALGAYDAFKMLWMAVSNGRWDLAGQLIKNGLLLGFNQAILAMKEAWAGLTGWMVQQIANAFRQVENNLPAWAKVAMAGNKVSLGAAASGLETASKASAQAGLADDRAAVTSAATDLAKTVAEIGRVEGLAQKKRERQLGGVGFGPALQDQMKTALGSSAAGTATSAGAFNIGRAGGANSVQEQQLDVLQAIAGGIEDVNENLENMEGVVVE